MKGVPNSTAKTHEVHPKDQSRIWVNRTREDGISECNMQNQDYSIILASYLWHKIDPKDHGWARQAIFPMWVSEAIRIVSDSHSISLYIATHIHMLAIAQGSLVPYKKDVIDALLENTKTEKEVTECKTK